ncbi:MAG: NADH pyrophosphatase [Pelotomaculum sp. PtaB.Bin104]|nr:MAG: NADH pyrophosphatase [Pelotomaculum sp. PtaB.Bin104]
MSAPEITAVEQDYWLIFNKDKLLTLVSHDTAAIPRTTDLAAISLESLKKYHLGKLDDCNCYAAEITAGLVLPENFKLIGLWHLFGRMEERFFWMAGRASQIINWDHTHQYCGRCGNLTNEKSEEHVKECQNCGMTFYPRISPVVIVSVIKEGEILLVLSKHFKLPFYTVISGFVESGETLEECVRREVKEEVGLDVKNITYFGSQPWPFPHSLMIGFTAEYDRGEILVDEEEIEDARWFSAGNMPNLPGSISIARQLIDYFVENNQAR